MNIVNIRRTFTLKHKQKPSLKPYFNEGGGTEINLKQKKTIFFSH